MTWKIIKDTTWTNNISKSWTIIALDNSWKYIPGNAVPRAPHWKESIPDWIFEPSEADFYYDEGDITTSKYNPVFRTYPTGPTSRTVHEPCGYWYKYLVLTSTVYPQELYDYIDVHTPTITSGAFDQVEFPVITLHYYGYGEDSIEISKSISGVFRQTVLSGYEEDSIYIGKSISGKFRRAIYTGYSGPDNIDISKSLSGWYARVVIRYENGLPESLDINPTVSGGVFETATEE